MHSILRIEFGIPFRMRPSVEVKSLARLSKNQQASENCRELAELYRESGSSRFNASDTVGSEFNLQTSR
jgi:hypothetical protein